MLVVDNDNKVQVRRVEIGGPRGTNMVLRKGLNAGERVVTEGIQRVRPGQVVKPTEMKPAEPERMISDVFIDAAAAGGRHLDRHHAGRRWSR